MRSRLQLACQLLFLSTIASSAQTPPRTTDATINENQSVEDTVEDWFFDFPISNYLEEAVEDTMTLYQTTVGEAWKYPMEGSSNANHDVRAMYQHATAETTSPLTIDARWTLDEDFNYAKEVSSFQTAETNDVPLDYQNTVEANQAQTIQAWLDQEQATVDVDAPSMLAIHVSAANTRNAPPATGRCHSCNISESPYWCSGPDGACTLCNLCGGGANEHQATVGEAWKYPTEGSSDANQSVEASMEGRTTMYQHATAETTRPVTKYASTKYAMEVSSFQTAASNNVPLEYQDTLEANQVPTIEEAWRDQDKDRVENWMTVYQPPTAEVNHHLTIGATSTDEDQAALDEARKRATEGSSDANQSFEASVEDETSRGCSWCKITASKWRRGAGGVRLCDTCGKAWSKNGVLPSGGMWRMRRHRIVPPASGMCILCKTPDVKKWLRGPDRVSNYCKKCGDSFSTFKKEFALAQEKNAGLKRFESEQMPFDVSDQGLTIQEAWKEELTARKERKRVLEEKSESSRKRRKESAQATPPTQPKY